MVELAIVLTIVGVMSVGGVLAIRGALNSSKYSNTRTTIEAITKELYEYSAVSRRLPTQAEFTSVISPTNDSFGKPIYYLPAGNLTSMVSSGTVAGICNVSSTSMSVSRCPDATCNTPTATYDNIAFFLASGATNENIQIDNTDTTNIEVYDDDITVDGYSADGTSTEGYDDIAGWMTLDALKQYAGCETDSLDIVENELEMAYENGKYSQTLNPLYGIAAYRWCMESSDADVRSNLFFGANAVRDIDGCDTAGDFITSDTIELRTATSAEIPSGTAGSSVIKVILQDSTNKTIFKEYAFNITGAYVLPVDNPPPGEPPVTLSANSFSSFMAPTGGGTYTVSDNALEFTLSSFFTIGASAFYGCGSDDYPGVACPTYGNKGLFSTYFTVDYQRRSGTARGFIFAVIKSEVDGNSTEREFESELFVERGLGYGGSSATDAGISGGNSFAVEFDLRQDGAKNDEDGDHIAIVSHMKVNQGDGTYISYGNNTHDAYTSGNSTIINDECTVSNLLGTGCYYHSGQSVIPNNRNAGNANLFGIRIDAISGCNSDGTVCDGRSAGNHNCIFVWRAMKTAMNADPALETNMTDTGTSHAYNNIVNGTAFPMGNPMLKQCIPDDTDSDNHLDKIRFGFTSAKPFLLSLFDRYSYEFTEFSIDIDQY
jgi:type II secretory pathway pseudopilin PulG